MPKATPYSYPAGVTTPFGVQRLAFQAASLAIQNGWPVTVYLSRSDPNPRAGGADFTVPPLAVATVPDWDWSSFYVGVSSAPTSGTLIVTPQQSPSLQTGGQLTIPPYWLLSATATSLAASTVADGSHSLTTRATYTVPAGRRAIVQGGTLSVALTTLDAVNVIGRMVLTLNGSPISECLAAASSIAGEVGSGQGNVNVQPGQVFAAGDVLALADQSGPDGASNSRYSGAIDLTEFSA